MGFLRRYTKSSAGTSEVIDSPLPAGLLLAVPHGAPLPDGTLLCDGTPVNKARFPELHAVLTNAYGSDAGANVTLPDFRGRAVVGVGTHADVVNRGMSDGLAVGSRTPKHAHTTASHTHSGQDHDHTSPGHTHSAESHRHSFGSHTHNLASHTHTVSGSLAATSGKPGNTGGNTVSDNTHSHGNGSYSLSTITWSGGIDDSASETPPDAGLGSSTNHPAGAIADTGVASPATSGAGTGDAVDPSTVIGFQTVRWAITTGRTKAENTRE